MKRLPLWMLLAILPALTLCGACAWEPRYEPIAKEELLIGCVYYGEPLDQSWSGNHAAAARRLLRDLELNESQLLERWNVDGQNCGVALEELAQAGCQIIFCTSFDHEPAMLAAAERYPDVQFCNCSGYLATAGDLHNAHNYYGPVAEARYVAGVAAAEQSAGGRLGFIAAYPNAECVSGLTAFFLGARSVNPDIAMEVIYLNSWSDARAEQRAAQELIDRGADVLSNHTDSGEPLRLMAELNHVCCVGWNAAPEPATAQLTRIICDWSVYMEYAVNCLLRGEPIDKDWRGGLAEGACAVAPLNRELADAAAQVRADAAQDSLISGELAVYAGPLYSPEGELLLEAGETYQEPCSAPGWDRLVAGITVLE